MSSTVHVSNISHQTTEKEVRDFFSFCGKITSLTLTPANAEPDASLSATVTYERDSAAKTALLLDGTKLGSNAVQVTSAHSLDEMASGHLAGGNADAPSFGAEDGVEPEAKTLRQEDKPRAAIFAEYLSHGYLIGDQALQKGIELDAKNGISARFTNYLTTALTTIDSKLHAIDHAKTFNTQYHVTDRALGAGVSLRAYFEKALGTPTGQKIRSYYNSTEKQVLDIHNEAKRLAELRRQEQAQAAKDKTTTPTTTAAATEGSSDPFADPEKTTCACSGDQGICSCEPGKCACAGCGKTGDPTLKASAGGQFGKTAFDAGNVAADYGSEKAKAL